VSSGAASGSAGQSDATPAAPGPGEFVNPVVSEDFPDPGALRVGKTFYLYATQGNGENIQVRTSPDLVTWTAQPDALPTLGRWAGAGKTWAPEVLAVDGSYVMFYTAADIASGRQCIGRAVAKSPGGPFTDTSAKPLVCQADEGGSIDASPFRAPDGSLYLYWKNDGNCCGLPVTLYGQEMDPAAATLTGRPVALLSNTQAWQGNLIEAPEMLSRNGSYYMFYAANDYGSDAYAEGFATCTGPLGPCKDNPEPLLKTTADAAGPGHAFLLTVGKETWILYHAWPPDAIGSARPGRQVWLDKVEWTAAGPEVDGPDAEPQPRPDVSVGG
jgi:beta-xylosidase